MADIPVTQDELALRRRARRRLVGAIAIALTAVLVLPMLFDPEPKPLGPEVDIRIPGQDTPFEPAPAQPAAPAIIPAEEPAPVEAEPTLPAPPATAEKPALPALAAGEKPAAKAPEQTPETAPEKAPEKPPVKPVEKPVEKAPEKAAPVPAKPEEAAAGKGYYLQLGAFGSETNAKLLQAKVQGGGFKAGISAAKGQFRVRVGPVADRAKALDYQAQLKAKGFNPVLVGP